MTENCFLMLKPGFAEDKRLVLDLTRQVKNLGLNVVMSSYKTYTKDEAKIHYLEKKDKSFYDELVDYLSSSKVFGLVVEGEDAISRSRELTEKLRVEFKEKYDLKTDVMRNIIHCTQKVNLNGNLVDIDSSKEINVFKNGLKEVKL